MDTCRTGCGSLRVIRGYLWESQKTEKGQKMHNLEKYWESEQGWGAGDPPIRLEYPQILKKDTYIPFAGI